MDGFTAYVIILLQVYNYVKMLYLNAALLLILLVIIGLMGGRISRRIRNLSMLIGIAVFIFALFLLIVRKVIKCLEWDKIIV